MLRLGRGRLLLAGAGLVLAACPDATRGGDDEAATEGSSSEADTQTGESTDTGVDALPPAPTLISPADGALDLPIQTELCWQPVEDPEGEALRYRVYVDGMSLSQGILEQDDPGYPGPCLGPLLFAHERSYTWEVEAFEVDDPERSSPRSEAWTFTTVDDGLSTTVFEDDFEAEPEGWSVAGEAQSGAWIHGAPTAATHLGASSQPGACASGSGCFFTGQNPEGLADAADVSGGATILLSPSFDLAGAAAATIQLERFFYKSELDAAPALEIELLTPDEGAPEGWIAHPLELLGEANAEAAANLWTAREYAACGLPMVAGSRLRLTARDPGAGILEAAVDSISVHAHDDASVCELGEGGRCEPELGDAACPGELLCCSQGVRNLGVYRCQSPVAGLDFENPPATASDPNNGALGCDAPDLIVDGQWLEPAFNDIFMSEGSCELLEGCVGGPGWRTIMRFTVSTPNIGSRDLAMGVPANEPDLFHYSACHDHHHFDEFARYELRDGDTIVATGHKQAFCLMDTVSWAWPPEFPTFDCVNQGISRGFTDDYDSGLPCQWVDVTDTPPGDYTLRITLNQPRPGHAQPVLNERDYANNVLEVPVTLP